MAALQKRGVSVIIGAPFASGILVTGSAGAAHYGYGKASPEVQAKVRGIEAVCKAHNVALPAAALQFVLAHPDRRLGDPRRGQAERSDAERRHRRRADPGRASGPTSRRRS